MPANDQTTQNVLTLILNDSEFKQYLHQELPERSPILISTNGLLSNAIKLEAHNVEFHSTKESDFYINVIEFSIGENRVDFKITYEIEGVTFSGVAVNSNGKWHLQEKNMFES
jgi:hypothetical protein